MILENTQTIGVEDPRVHLADLLDRAAMGEEITITRRGAPVARLAPVKPAMTSQQRRAAIEQIFALGQQVSQGGLNMRPPHRDAHR